MQTTTTLSNFSSHSKHCRVVSHNAHKTIYLKDTVSIGQVHSVRRVRQQASLGSTDRLASEAFLRACRTVICTRKQLWANH